MLTMVSGLGRPSRRVMLREYSRVYLVSLTVCLRLTTVDSGRDFFYISGPSKSSVGSTVT